MPKIIVASNNKIWDIYPDASLYIEIRSGFLKRYIGGHALSSFRRQKFKYTVEELNIFYGIYNIYAASTINWKSNTITLKPLILKPKYAIVFDIDENKNVFIHNNLDIVYEDRVTQYTEFEELELR